MCVRVINSDLNLSILTLAERGGETNIVSWREIVSQISVKKVMKGGGGKGVKIYVILCNVRWKEESERKRAFYLYFCVESTVEKLLQLTA
jgi:hypothetical protein